MKPALRVIVITYNGREEIFATVRALKALPESPPITVMQNGPENEQTARLHELYPDVQIVALGSNIGAAARTEGVLRTTEPFLAFCDDDTFWAPKSLEQAVRMLNEHPSIAVLTAKVYVGEECRTDPICRELEESPLTRPGLPGPLLVGFLAGASVVRRQAFIEAGGFRAEFHIGGEERLLAAELISRCWDICYVPQLSVFHLPSKNRDDCRRAWQTLRNNLWFSWLRLPAGRALHDTAKVLNESFHSSAAMRALLSAMLGLPWVIRARKVVPPRVASMFSLVEAAQKSLLEVPGNVPG